MMALSFLYISFQHRRAEFVWRKPQERLNSFLHRMLFFVLSPSRIKRYVCSFFRLFVAYKMCFHNLNVLAIIFSYYQHTLLPWCLEKATHKPMCEKHGKLFILLMTWIFLWYLHKSILSEEQGRKREHRKFVRIQTRVTWNNPQHPDLAFEDII